ncbi:hypothetical protein BpHYR1_037700 [Brachionus plicatilis]|uniref:Uncharacterized protein n=1 Tax=Brachionus plicatilis TaxID=10195 RepID=A0A3M7P892_BRAPC|nr:hypothetical protein BpHYR1_037700 [Brachionus plicatilis]
MVDCITSQLLSYSKQACGDDLLRKPSMEAALKWPKVGGSLSAIKIQIKEILRQVGMELSPSFQPNDQNTII